MRFPEARAYRDLREVFTKTDAINDISTLVATPLVFVLVIVLLPSRQGSLAGNQRETPETRKT